MKLALFFVVFVLIVIALIELPSLKKSKNRRDMIAYLFFYTIAVVISILATLRLPVPSPLTLVTFIYKPIHSLLKKWIGL